MASLTALPVEIQCAIFRFLDPIGLISTSQASKGLRDIIQPRRRDLVERLLQLECDEKAGGVTLSFNSRNNILQPNWTQPEWTTMRWACSGCLRLLPHQWFDNHSILRLAYRKPIPRSPAASACTTWESTPKANPYLPHLRRQNRFQTDANIQERQTQRRYGLALSSRYNEAPYAPGLDRTYAELQSCGWTAFENMTFSEFIHMDPDQKQIIFENEVKSIELARCGYKRHLRKCHECRYQAGQLKPRHIGSDSALEITFATSRQYRIATPLDRFFPRFSEALENKRPANDPPSYAIYRHNVRDRFWTMYMIRCPDCEKWKEARLFQLGTTYSTRNLSMYCHTYVYFHLLENALLTSRKAQLENIKTTELRCHHCSAKKYGRDQFGIALSRELKHALWTETSRLQYRLGHGWHCLLFRPELGKFPKVIQQEIHNIGDEPDALVKIKDRSEGERFTPADLTLFRQHYDEWMAMRARLLAPGTSMEKLIRGREEGAGASWFCLWIHNYDSLEAFYRWLQAVQIEVEQKTEVLVDWALGGAMEEMPPTRNEPYDRRPR